MHDRIPRLDRHFRTAVLLLVGTLASSGALGLAGLVGSSGARARTSESTDRQRLPVLRPPALAEGAVIGVVAPAYPLEQSTVDLAVRRLQERGYRVKLSLGYKSPDGYLASDDATRAAELNAYFRDPEIDAILCMRGGFGSPRIVDQLDYEAIRRKPKIFIGYSDITAVLNAIFTRSRVVTFHGPMLSEFGRGRGPTAYSEKYFWSALQPESPQLEACKLYADWGGGGPAGRSQLRTRVGGQAEGRLVGGNLSVLVATIGTPWEALDEGCILFLEDVSEKPFRIDRMLNQMRLAGKLARYAGVILGTFTGCHGSSGVTVDDVFDDYFGNSKVPVLQGFPTGHVPDQATLPVGLRVRLDATARKVSFLELPVVPSGQSE